MLEDWLAIFINQGRFAVSMQKKLVTRKYVHCFFCFFFSCYYLIYLFTFLGEGCWRTGFKCFTETCIVHINKCSAEPGAYVYVICFANSK